MAQILAVILCKTSSSSQSAYIYCFLLFSNVDSFSSLKIGVAFMHDSHVLDTLAEQWIRARLMLDNLSQILICYRYLELQKSDSDILVILIFST